MSCRNYRVSFASRNETVRVVRYVRRIVVDNQVSEERRRILSRLDWQPVGFVSDIDIPDDFAECNLTEQRFEEPEAIDHSFLISVDDHGVSLTFTDCNLPDEVCEQVAGKFAHQTYKKATGKEISKEKISVKPIAGVRFSVCSFCLESTVGFSFSCPVCGKSFCYDHRRPEAHGCPPSKKKNGSSVNLRKAKASASEKNKDVRIMIQQIPCG